MLETTPLETYTERLSERRSVVRLQERRDVRLANLRLLVFAGGVVLTVQVIRSTGEHAAWLLLPAFLFLVLIVLHDRVLKKKNRAERAVGFYEKGMDRLEGRWAGNGTAGEEWMPENHPYAEDLDIFGVGSLFELLCTVRTRMGEETLSRWLCAPADQDTIRDRQEAVEELRGNTALRETLGVLGEAVRSGLHRKHLTEWAASPPLMRFGSLPHIAAWLATITAAVLVYGWGFRGWPGGLIAGVFVLDLLYLSRMKVTLMGVLGPMDRAVRDLTVLAEVARVLEDEHFTAPLLKSLQGRLASDDASASHSIVRLSHLVEWMDAQRNQLFFPIAVLVLWPVHFAYALERWRLRHGGSVDNWFDALGELEALCAVSMYAYEHPADPFPVMTEGGTRYDGTDLGHPLLETSASVANSVSLDEDHSLIMVSGSNMSGKSTLLRVVGINAVLAFAGAPIRAKSLTLSPLRVAASLHITDSIQKGMSHFYAEILRLKIMLELTGGAEPVLFLIDEMLHGTNSHDRHVGSEAVLCSLVKNGAVGLVTTHDLSLTQIAEDMDGRGRNVHFADHLEGDRLAFDYRMRDGVVEKSNALSLMRSIGLDV